MASKRVVKLSTINVFFENDNKAIVKGENAFESGHVQKVEFDSTLKMLQGQVQASMKNTTYNVQVCTLLNIRMSVIIRKIFLG